MKKKAFDLLTLGEILLRLSPPDNERIVRGETFQKQVGGAELNVASGVSPWPEIRYHIKNSRQ